MATAPEGPKPVETDEGKNKFAPSSKNAWHIRDDQAFWTTYLREAGESDKELIEGWNKSLDTLLIFAGLFSAVNTAFIVESYAHLKPDSADATIALLRLLLVHRNDDVDFSDADLGFLSFNPPTPSIRVNSIFFSSLSCSLIAAFGAVTAKQWLAHYSRIGLAAPLDEQARRRQSKYRGLETWHFWLLMELLSALLQLSLVLFLVGTIDFIWPMSWKVATVILALSATGSVAYICTFAIAIIFPHSPFQTSLSNALRLVLKSSFSYLQKTPRYLRLLLKSSLLSLYQTLRVLFTSVEKPSPSSLSGNIDLSTDTTLLFRMFKKFKPLQAARDIQLICYIAFLGMWAWILYRLGREEEYGAGIPQDISPGWSKEDEGNAECVLWLVEQAEDPQVLQRSLNTIPLLSPNHLLSFMKSQKGVVEHLVALYNSHVAMRSSGHGIPFISSQPMDVIITGTALFHVLKVADEGDTHMRALMESLRHTYVRPEEATGADIDVALALIICAVNTLKRPGNYGDTKVLKHLFHWQCTTMSPAFRGVTSPAITNHQSSGTATLVTSTTLFSTLLDLLIFWLFWIPEPTRFAEWGVEQIFGDIHAILQDRPSPDIVGHIIVAVAAVQWKAHEHGLVKAIYPPLHNTHSMEHAIKQSWYATDKRDSVLDNIINAILLVGDFTRCPNTLKIYRSLLDIMEDLLTMSFMAYPNIQLVQAFLRIHRQVPQDLTTNHIVLHLVQCFAPVGGIPSLYLHDEFGSSISILVDSVIGSPVPLSKETRFDFMIHLVDMINGSEQEFLDIITSPTGLYRYRERIISFFISVSKDFDVYHPHTTRYISMILNASEESPELCMVQIDTMLQLLMDAPGSDVFDGAFPALISRLRKITQEDSTVHWPSYFESLGILTLDQENDGVLTLNQNLILGSKYPIWAGEAILLIWTASCAGQWGLGLTTSSLFFAPGVLATIFKYYQEITQLSYGRESVQLLRGYLIRAKDVIDGESVMVQEELPQEVEVVEEVAIEVELVEEVDHLVRIEEILTRLEQDSEAATNEAVVRERVEELFSAVGVTDEIRLDELGDGKAE